MKSTSLSLRITLFCLFVWPLLASCNQKVDIYIYPNESWQVKSKLTFTKLERTAIDLLDEQVAQWILSITEGIPIPEISLSENTLAGVLDVLTAHYGSLGIDFRWSSSSTRYNFIIKGQNLRQFEQLLPGTISLKKVGEDQFHLKVTLPEFNIYTIVVNKQEITLHTGGLILHNAPRPEGNKVTWINPVEMDATFLAASVNSDPPWELICGLLLIVLLITVVVFMISRRRSPLEIEE